MLGSAAYAAPASPPKFVGTDREQDEILEVISTARSRSFKPVGHTSVVLRMRTIARVTAAMKLRSERIPDGFRHEIAAYRVGRLLGLDNVPPAIFRRATWKEIRRRFHEDKLDERSAVRRAVVWDDDGSAPGAAIYWVKRMRKIGLDHTRQWTAWLSDAKIPRGKRELARDLSTMVVFDFLIGNWDRLSGGNLSTDVTRSRAILRDNDRAFSTPLLPRRHDRLLAALTRTHRFSSSVVQKLVELDEPTLRAELSEDPSHSRIPLLDDRQVRDLFERRATVLSYIGALIEARGEDAVLVFP